MQVTVPPAGTALREMFGREASEGHCLVAASWLHAGEHLPSQKQEMRARSLEFNKSLANHALAEYRSKAASPII